MKFFSVTLFSVFFSLMSVVQVAEAKRFGAGKSFGYNKQVAPKSYNTQTTNKQTTSTTKPTAASAPAKTGSAKWLGPLAGLAAGGFLAWMLFGEGFEGMQLLDILILALIAFMLFKLFVRRAQSNGAYQEADGNYQSRQAETFNPAQTQQRASQESQSTSHHGGSIIGADLSGSDTLGQGISSQAHFYQRAPQWFDAERFVTDAKQHFMSLQQAWDNVDLATIKDYCSEDLYRALSAELAGVEPGHNLTLVDTLDAELAAMAVDGEYFIASVRFSGFIEEQAGEGAHAFNEIWHIRRLADDQGNWEIAGIQQANASL